MTTRWTAAAAAATQRSSALPIDSVPDAMPALLAGQGTVWFPFGRHPDLSGQIEGWLASLRAQERRGVECPTQCRDLHPLIAEMRLIKDAGELATMRRAASSCWPSCRPAWPGAPRPCA